MNSVKPSTSLQWKQDKLEAPISLAGAPFKGRVGLIQRYAHVVVTSHHSLPTSLILPGV